MHSRHVASLAHVLPVAAVMHDMVRAFSSSQSGCSLDCRPAERSTLFVLLADGTLQVCVVSGAALAVAHALPIAGINAAAERVMLHAWAHPSHVGGVLLAVEAAVSGVSILEAAPRWAGKEARGWRRRRGAC